MKFGYLKDFFGSYASKQVTATEVDPSASNGHEFNSSKVLREILGTTTRKCKDGTGFPTRFFYFSDDEDEEAQAFACLSWYDSRANHKTRTEWRLYYTDNEVIGRMGCARTNDSLIIAFSPDFKSATVLVAASGSTIESQLRWLFGISEEQTRTFLTMTVEPGAAIDAARARILEAIGVVVPTVDETLLEKMLKRFGNAFPSSSEFSRFVRKDAPEICVQDGSDLALQGWMEREEFAFRVLERHLVSERLKNGFQSVDDFVTCSLSVQNRRKARAGRAFENHLSEIFRAHGLVFERGAQVENRAKPDFLFPGAEQYFYETFPSGLLTLLGAKTSCKDRWRQVLAEGKRLTEKYLVTLEPAISRNQIAEMKGESLQLVVPAGLHSTYSSVDRDWLWDVKTFVASTLSRQKKAHIAPVFSASESTSTWRKKQAGA